MRAWRLYSSLLTSHPRTTNLATAGIVSAIADIAAQRIEYNHSRRLHASNASVTNQRLHHHTPPVVTNTTTATTATATVAAAATVVATPSTALSLLSSTSSNVPLPVSTISTTYDEVSSNGGGGTTSTSLSTSEQPNDSNVLSGRDGENGVVIWLPNGYRLATMTLYGTIMGGHIFSMWYRWLDRTFIGTSSRVVATKVILNQLTMAPINNSCFFGWIQLTDPTAAEHGLIRPNSGGQPAITFVERWYAKLYNDLPRTTAGSLLFWGPYQTINFRFVPSNYRVLFQSAGVLAWTLWVNLIGHK